MDALKYADSVVFSKDKYAFVQANAGLLRSIVCLEQMVTVQSSTF